MTDSTSQQAMLSDPCPKCSGGGELVVVGRDGRERLVKGTTAFDMITHGGWEHVDVRECPRCGGYGRINP